MKKVISAAIWLFVLLTGTPKVCAATFEGHHLATQIDITAQQQLHRFRQSDNIEAVLNFLRLLEYAGLPQTDPEQQLGDYYRITVQLADGRRHIYHLHSNRYLSRDFHPWIKIKTNQALEELLQSLPEE